MARRLNYTGRRKITRGDLSIRIIHDQDDISFTADLRLGDYGFPPDARVHIEAYRGLSALWKRFDFGRVALNEPQGDLSLKEFDHPEGILFRIKVSAEGEHRGRLLGEADGIRPQLPDDAEQPATPIIDVDRGALGGEPWRVAFHDGESAMPTLIINDRIEDWNSRARDPLFRAIVLPNVMRQVLTRVLVIDADIGDEDNPDNWRQRWLRFAESLPNITDHPEPIQDGEDLVNREDLTNWIDDAVSAFGLRSGLIDGLVSRWNAESQP